MRSLVWLCAGALLATACGGGGTESSSSQGPAASPTRAVATLAAPISTVAAPSAAAASSAAASAATAAPVASVAAANTPAASVAGANTPAASAATSAAPPPASTAPTAAPAAPTAAPQTPPPATAAPAQPAFNGTVKVTLTDNAVRPDRTSAPAGSITFSIVNTGVLAHELIVLQTSTPQDQLPLSTTDPKMVQTPGQVGAASNIAAGATATLTLNLAAGPYVLICNIENHYKDGMHTAFTVGGS